MEKDNTELTDEMLDGYIEDDEPLDETIAAFLGAFGYQSENINEIDENGFVD